MNSYLLTETPKSQLTAEQPSTTTKRLELTKRYILHPKTKKNEMVGEDQPL